MKENKLLELSERIKRGEVTNINILVDKLKEVSKENPNDYDLGELVREAFLIK